jgi:hypothetical protein
MTLFARSLRGSSAKAATLRVKPRLSRPSCDRQKATLAQEELAERIYPKAMSASPVRTAAGSSAKVAASQAGLWTMNLLGAISR